MQCQDMSLRLTRGAKTARLSGGLAELPCTPRGGEADWAGGIGACAVSRRVIVRQSVAQARVVGSFSASCCSCWVGRPFGDFTWAMSGGFSGEAMSPNVSGEAVLGRLPAV